MLDLIMDLKACLALILLTGLITGYLFSKFSAKEKFVPIIKQHKENIVNKNDEILQLDKKEENIAENIAQYNTYLQEGKDRVRTHEKTIQTTEEENSLLLNSNKDAHNKEQQKKVSLENQISKVNTLKTTIGSNTPDVVLQYSKEQKEKMAHLTKTLEEQKVLLYNITKQHQDVLASWTEVNKQKIALEKSIHEIDDTLLAAKQEENSIADTMQTKINTIKAESNALLKQIEFYKNRLLSLKDKFSS